MFTAIGNGVFRALVHGIWAFVVYQLGMNWAAVLLSYRVIK